MKNPKRNKLIIAAVIIAVLAVCFLPWRHKIDRTLQGVQCRLGDADYIENRTVYVNGVYSNYLFRDDKFSGKIEVEGYDYTSGADVALVFYDNNANIGIYDDIVKEYRHMVMYTNPTFSKLMLLVHESTGTGSGWSGENGLFISAPASDRKQAVNVAKNLVIRDNWLSNVPEIWS